MNRLPLLGLLAFLTLSGCGDPNLQHANALASALTSFDSQKKATRPVVDDAQEKLREAQQVDFRPESAETQAFRREWSSAEASVTQLREKYDEVVKHADFHFGFVEKKISSMSTAEIQDKLSSVVSEKRMRFVDAAKRSNSAIEALEKLVDRGNDIIKALDVINALDAVSDDSVALIGLMDDANSLMPALDELVTVGNSIVDIELGK
jgi:hypothetical protein